MSGSPGQVLEQGFLLDLGSAARLGSLAHHLDHTILTDGAWIDVRRGWVQGADSVFQGLLTDVPWRRESRRMYDRMVEVPRLVCFYDDFGGVPNSTMVAAGAALTRHYADEFPNGFATAGLCLYRGGEDSVAWHGDRIGRSATQDTLIAIVSLGAPRTLALRRRGGGPSTRVTLDSGDLLVMGGSCQRTWEHAVPKTARPVGARISVQFRERGVR